jgi:hypothetical protein
MDDKQLLSIVNASGFPFQLRVQQVIRESQSQHMWGVISAEHRWAIPEENREGFIDLVLEAWPRRMMSVRMVLECKRVRGGCWVFLLNLSSRGA